MAVLYQRKAHTKFLFSEQRLSPANSKYNDVISLLRKHVDPLIVNYSDNILEFVDNVRASVFRGYG